MIQYCETHKVLVPEGYVNKGITTRLADGTWGPKPGICPGYGRVEYIDSDGFAELDRDPCKIVEYTPA